MENQIQKINCPICGNEVKEWGHKNGYDLWQCLNCGLVFVYPLPNPELVYSEDYFSGAKKGFGYVDYDEDKKPMIPTFEKYISLFKKFGKEKGKIFDIGAATGFFLDLCRKEGFDVSGVEISDFAADVARKKGIPVKTGTLDNCDIEKNSLDIVTMLDVLEHVTNPSQEIIRSKELLKEGGLLVVNAPNGQSLLAKMLKDKWHLVVPPEHLFYFSPKNLGQFLEKNGFKVIYSGTIGKRFTFSYIFKTLYKWQKIKAWEKLAGFFSKGRKSKFFIPINLYDNFFLIAQKNEK